MPQETFESIGGIEQMDALMILFIILFFALTWALLKMCESLLGKE